MFIDKCLTSWNITFRNDIYKPLKKSRKRHSDIIKCFQIKLNLLNQPRNSYLSHHIIKLWKDQIKELTLSLDGSEKYLLNNELYLENLESLTFQRTISIKQSCLPCSKKVNISLLLSSFIERHLRKLENLTLLHFNENEIPSLSVQLKSFSASFCSAADIIHALRESQVSLESLLLFRISG